MNRITWIAVAVLMVGAVWGCGGGGEDSSNTTTTQAKDAPPAATMAAPAPVVSVAAATPQEAVNSFLDALRAGNDEEAAALLTTKAREETVRNDMVVRPPGAPNAKYTVGRVEYPEGKELAYVSCIWSEQYEQGQEESYEVVWILRQEPGGWRVAGMATQLVETGPPVVLNFEDLADMEQKILQAELAVQNGTAQGDTRQATTPADTTVR